MITARSDVSEEGSTKGDMPRTDSMVFADDVREYDEKNREQQRLTEKKNDENRYGKNIKGEYKVASWVIMITIVIGIFLIPGQLFLQGVMKQVEDPMITDL